MKNLGKVTIAKYEVTGKYLVTWYLHLGAAQNKGFLHVFFFFFLLWHQLIIFFSFSFLQRNSLLMFKKYDKNTHPVHPSVISELKVKQTGVSGLCLPLTPANSKLCSVI